MCLMWLLNQLTERLILLQGCPAYRDHYFYLRVPSVKLWPFHVSSHARVHLVYVASKDVTVNHVIVRAPYQHAHMHIRRAHKLATNIIQALS